MLKRAIRKLANAAGYDIVSLSTQRTFQEDVSFRQYKDKHEGERCVIIGSGPSLNETNLDLLENEITFGLNKVFLLFPKISFRPTYVASYVPDVVAQCTREFEELPMPLFVSSEGYDLLSERRFETHRFGPIRRFYFSLDPAKEICVGHTVTYVTMQLAFYMGFQQVILIGIDHDFGYDGPPDTWHVIDKPPKGRHFVEDYFAPGQTWQSPNLKMAEAHYALAKAVYEHFGREIVDCTVQGKLQVFRKSSLEDTLG
jgi:hypothetical protein